MIHFLFFKEHIIEKLGVIFFVFLKQVSYAHLQCSFSK